MHKIVLMIAYFGPLPPYAEVFFQTLQANPSLELILITDQTLTRLPENVRVRTMSFDTMKERVQSKFDFPVCLDKPYKLCDYKPAYGYIFEEELRDCTFWGHCDLDMVLGDVLRFLPDPVLDSYDKIYQLGHLCLYRNTPENNRRFMEPGGMDYRKVFTTPVICVFDEIIGMHKKYEILGIPAYNVRDCADISPWYHRFLRVESHLTSKQKINFNYEKQVFYWEDGHVYRAAVTDTGMIRDEFNYLHFQKRNLAFLQQQVSLPRAFFITRNGFIPKEAGREVTAADIEKYNGHSILGHMRARIKYQLFVFKRRFNKYILKK